jgi:hypothetical protein
MNQFISFLTGQDENNKNKVEGFYRLSAVLEGKKLPFELYNELPRKLTIMGVIKNRKIIKNYLNFQTNIYQETYIERSLVTTVNEQNEFIQNYSMLLCLPPLCLSMFREYFILGTISFIGIITLPTIFSIAYYNEFLQKFQINSFYKLGRDTQDFVRYLNNEPLKFREQSYFDKFKNELTDIPLDKGEKLLSYVNSDKKEKLEVYDHVLDNLEKKRNKDV